MRAIGEVAHPLVEARDQRVHVAVKRPLRQSEVSMSSSIAEFI